MKNIFNWPPKEKDKYLNYEFQDESALTLEYKLYDDEIIMGKEEVDQGR